MDTSKPEGAVTVTSPVRFAPLTVKVCGVEAVPAVVLNAANVPMVVIEGGGTTVPLSDNDWLVAPVLDTVMLPDTAPTGAVAVIRTKTEDTASEPLLGVSAREAKKLVPSIDTSKLAGAAIVTFPVRLAPLTVKVCMAEAVPWVAGNGEKLETAATAGWEPTTPEAGSVLSGAPLELIRIFPETMPLGTEAVNRTEIVVEATDPLICVSVREVKKFVPSVDTSKLAVAVTVTLPMRLAPLTVKVCAAEAVPCVAVNAASVPVTVIAGGGTTVPPTPTVLLLAPPLETVMLPLGEPTFAAVRRTEIVELARVPPL